ncbi:hypothetical protein BB558_001018 [Smittium angustum]|uniref:Rapamycin-insensitive companion of mTOR domain-containing protein n=1 Tax=Smittium angustum TaxID=133377 RepID=A0A2U1JCV2_SMIAN|nr:hypothetical protein BB558_001018 [Smittium angustum]
MSQNESEPLLDWNEMLNLIGVFGSVPQSVGSRARSASGSTLNKKPENSRAGKLIEHFSQSISDYEYAIIRLCEWDEKGDPFEIKKDIEHLLDLNEYYESFQIRKEVLDLAIIHIPRLFSHQNHIIRMKTYSIIQSVIEFEDLWKIKSYLEITLSKALLEPDKYISEREQALKFIRWTINKANVNQPPIQEQENDENDEDTQALLREYKEKLWNCTLVTNLIIRTFISIVEQPEDKMRNMVFETLCEILIIKPQVLVKNNCIKVLVNGALDGPYHVTVAVISSLQHFIDNPENRKYISPNQEFEVIVSALTSDDDTTEMGKERAKIAVYILSQLLKSWSGLQYIVSGNNSIIRSVFQSIETIPTHRNTILGMLFDLFGLAEKFDKSKQENKTGYKKDVTSLENISDLLPNIEKSIFPLANEFRPTEYYRTLIFIQFINLGLFHSLFVALRQEKDTETIEAIATLMKWMFRNPYLHLPKKSMQSMQSQLNLRSIANESLDPYETKIYTLLSASENEKSLGLEINSNFETSTFPSKKWMKNIHYRKLFDINSSKIVKVSYKTTPPSQLLSPQSTNNQQLVRRSQSGFLKNQSLSKKSSNYDINQGVSVGSGILLGSGSTSTSGTSASVFPVSTSSSNLAFSPKSAKTGGMPTGDSPQKNENSKNKSTDTRRTSSSFGRTSMGGDSIKNSPGISLLNYNKGRKISAVAINLEGNATRTGSKPGILKNTNKPPAGTGTKANESLLYGRFSIDSKQGFENSFGQESSEFIVDKNFIMNFESKPNSKPGISIITSNLNKNNNTDMAQFPYSAITLPNKTGSQFTNHKNTSSPSGFNNLQNQFFTNNQFQRQPVFQKKLLAQRKENFLKLLDKSLVLKKVSYFDWDWDIINQILFDDILMDKQILDDLIKNSLFLHRLARFYMPSGCDFCGIVESSLCVMCSEAGIQLIKVLMFSGDGMLFVDESNLVSDIVSHLLKLRNSDKHGYNYPDREVSCFTIANMSINPTTKIYFNMLREIGQSSGGLGLLEQHNLFDTYYKLVDKENPVNISYLLEYILNSIDCYRDGHGRLLVNKLIASPVESYNLSVFPLLFRLSTSGILCLTKEEALDLVLDWSIPGLIRLLYSPHINVSKEAVHTLVCIFDYFLHQREKEGEYINDDDFWFADYFLLKNPKLDLIEPQILRPLLLKLASTDKGVQYLEDLDLLEPEMDSWKEEVGINFVFRTELQIAKDLAHGPLFSNSSLSSDSFSSFKTKEIPEHLFGQLSYCKKGIAALNKSDITTLLAETLGNIEWDSTDYSDILGLKATLLAIGSICVSDDGFLLMEKRNVISQVLQVAQMATVASLKGTCIFVIGQISRNKSASKILANSGWVFCYSHTNMYQYAVPPSISFFFKTGDWRKNNSILENIVPPKSILANPKIFEKGDNISETSQDSIDNIKNSELKPAEGSFDHGSSLTLESGEQKTKNRYLDTSTQNNGYGSIDFSVVHKDLDSIQIEILTSICNMTSQITIIQNSKVLTRLRASHPHYFRIEKLFEIVLHILSCFKFRLSTRRFILGLFDVNYTTFLVHSPYYKTHTRTEYEFGSSQMSFSNPKSTPHLPLPTPTFSSFTLNGNSA